MISGGISPTYDVLFAIDQSNYRVQLSEKAASLFVIGAI